VGAFFAKIGTWLVSAMLPTLLDWIWSKIENWKKNREQKKQEDKKVDDSVGKVEDGDLKEGLEGTDELEDELNRNT
jgi:hypothetical protein